MATQSDDIKWLYDNLKAKGYNIGTEQEFTHSLANEEDRQWYYEKGKGMGLELGSMDDFNTLFAPQASPAIMPTATPQPQQTELSAPVSANTVVNQQVEQDQVQSAQAPAQSSDAPLQAFASNSATNTNNSVSAPESPKESAESIQFDIDIAKAKQAEKKYREEQKKAAEEYENNNTWLTLKDGRKITVADYNMEAGKGNLSESDVEYDPRKAVKEGAEYTDDEGNSFRTSGSKTVSNELSNLNKTDSIKATPLSDPARFSFYDISDPYKHRLHPNAVYVLDNPDDAYRAKGGVSYAGTEIDPFKLTEVVVKGERKFDTSTYEGAILEEARKRIRAEKEKYPSSAESEEYYEADFWNKVEEVEREYRETELQRQIESHKRDILIAARTLSLPEEYREKTGLQKIDENIDIDKFEELTNNPYFQHLLESDPDLKAMWTSLGQLEKAQSYINSVKQDKDASAGERFFRGMGGALKETVTNFLGIPEYIDYKTGIGPILNKAKDGGKLTEEEQDAVSSWVFNQMTAQEYQYSHEHNVGEFTGAMAEMMIEFGLNPASGLTRSVIANACKRAGVTGFRALLRTSPNLLSKLKILGKAGGALLGEAATLSATTQLAKNLNEAERRQVSLTEDNNGNVIVDKGESAGQAYGKTFTNSVLSDMLFLTHTGFGGRLLEKVPKVKEALTTAVKNNPFNDPIDALVKIKGAEAIKLITGEIAGASEMDPTLKDFLDPEKNLELVVGILAAEYCTGGAVRQVNRGVRRGKLNLYLKVAEEERNQKIANYDELFDSNVDTRDLWSNIVNTLNEGSNDEVIKTAQNLAWAIRNDDKFGASANDPLVNAARGLNEFQRAALFDVIRADMGRRGLRDRIDVEYYGKTFYDSQNGAEAGAEGEPAQVITDPEHLFSPFAKSERDVVEEYVQSERSGATESHTQEDATSPQADNALMEDGGSDIVERMHEAEEIFEDAFGAEAEYNLVRLNDNPRELLNDPELTDDQREAVRHYIQVNEELNRALNDSESSESRSLLDEAPPEEAGNNVLENIHADTEAYDRGYEQGIEVSTNLTDNELNDVITDLRGRDFLSDEWRGRLEAYEYEQQRRQMEGNNAVPENAESVPNIAGNAENTTENRELVTESVPNSVNPVENVQQTALSRIPVDEETQEPRFTAVDPETAWDGLVEAMDGEANALPIAQQMIEDANKKFEALNKKPPTPAKPKLAGKAGPMAMRAEQKRVEEANAKAQTEYQQALADAQAEAQAWSNILSVYTNRTAELRRQQEEARRQRDAEAHDAAVAQFEEQQRIKAEKQAEQEERGAYTPHPDIRKKWDESPKFYGPDTFITLADGTEVPGNFVYHEAFASTPSHDPFNGYEQTEGFPVTPEGRSVNPRAYNADKNAQYTTEEIAANYDTRGIRDDKVVQHGVRISGNGGDIALKMAYKMGTADKFKAGLARKASEEGIPADDFNSLQYPDRSFVPTQEFEYTPEVFDIFNRERGKGLGRDESAVRQGMLVADDTLKKVVSVIGQYDKLEDFYRNDTATSEVLGLLMSAGVFDSKDLGKYRNGTEISGAGEDLIESVLVGKVFDGDPDAVRKLADFKEVRRAVVSAMSEISANRALTNREFSIDEELSKAIDLVYRAKKAQPEVYVGGMPVSPFGRMAGLFDDEFGDSRVTDSTVLMLADILNSGRHTELRKVLACYNKDASESASGQMDLWTGTIPTKEEILTNVNDRFKNGTAKEKQALVDAAIAERKEHAAGLQERGGSEGVEQVEYAGERSEASASGGRIAGDAGGDSQRTGDLAEAEEVGCELSEEVNEFGKPFVVSSDGTTEFGYIEPESGLTPLPIKLSLGENYKDEKGDDHGYGYLHIDAGHRSEILQNGFSSIEEFVESVARNYTVIKEGAKIGNHQTYLLEVSDEHNNTLFIQLSRDGKYWNVNSAGIFKKKYSRRKPEVYSKPAVGGGKDTDTTEVNSGQSKGATAPAGNSSETSDGKDSTLSSDKQESGAESSLSERISEAEKDVNLSPTEAQKRAGNYKKGHVQVGSFDITIENPAGSTRTGVDANGKAWSTTMANSYGYIKGTQSADGDPLDVFISSDIDGWNGRKVFVVDQFNPDGTFDEHKVMLGFNDKDEAFDAYLSNYEDGWENGRRLEITESNVEDFEKWTGSAKRKIKPFSEYAGLKTVCPVCGKTGIPNYHTLYVVCPQCDSDLSVFRHIDQLSDEDAAQTLANIEKMEREILGKSDKHDTAEAFTITPTKYEGKHKTSDVWLVKFNRELTVEEKAALHTFVRGQLTEGKKTSRGWFDRKQGGYMMRSEEAARKLGEMIGNEEAVADAQPMTAQELREAVAHTSSTEKPAKQERKPKKAPINRVSLDDVMTDLSTKGETQLSDHAEPVKTEPEVQHEISDDEMQSLLGEIRDILGIGEDEGNTNIKFRDPGELTPQERMKLQSAGIRVAMGLISRGTTSFPDYATKMVGLLGDKIRPWLKSFYEGARWTPGYEKIAFTPSEEVARFDVQNFDKEQTNPIAQAAMIVEERKASTASAQAQKELTEIRNNKRKKQDEQTSADTEALGEKADTIAGKAESLAETSEDERELNQVSDEIDDTIDEINDQLALLGYYEADLNSPEHEVYGLRRSAEKKAVKDAVKLAKQLVDDLGIEIDKVAGKTTEQMQKSRGKNNTAVRANIAQVGGDITVDLPYPDGRNLHISIGLSPTHECGVEPNRRGGTWEGDNYEVDNIMFRFGDSHNHFLPTDVTYGKMLGEIQRAAKWGQPKKQETPKGPLSPADKPADASKPSEEAYHGTVTLKDGREAVVIVANHTETMGEPALLTDYIVGVKGEPGTITISPEEIAHAGAPTAEDIPSHANEEESHNGYKRGDDVLWDRYGNGKWEKVKIEDFDADGSPIFESVKGIMSEKGDWSRIKPADGVFGEAKRVATEAHAERAKQRRVDNQGNPVDGNGKLILDEVKSVGEITDEDFMNPARNVALPKLPDVVSTAIGAEGRLAIIKKNIFEKNRDTHKDLTADDSRRILNEVLYNPHLYGQNQKKGRPYNWILVHLADKNSSVILEVNPTKDYLEIVNWHYLNGRQLEQKKRQAEREGGRILTLSENNVVGDTSQGLSSGGKVTKKDSKKQIKPEQQVGDLFSGLLDEPISDEKKTDVQPRSGTAERERGHEPQPNEPLGESQRNEVKPTDGGGMVGRDNNNPQSNATRGTGVSEQSKKQLEPVPEAERKNVRNNHAERGVDYAPKGEDARIKANIEAIELAKRLLDAGETATPEQMATLRKFSGWGGLGKAFSDNGYNPTSKRLRELLGEDGYNDAVMSRNSAYYTPAPVIDAMWDVARALGFKGGNVLEGSAGIGNILGLMPTDISDRSNIHAVEIDSTTGGILSLLYPDAKVDIQGFERTKVRNNSVDLAITNVPFVTGLHVMDDTGDKDLSKKFRNIHDFCIAKNIRKLREGGLGIFITSSGTMDNSKELRCWITNEGNADVIGAFRMHNKTFGGTGATSDIIVVRKRVNGKPSAYAIDVADVTGVRVVDYDTGETRKVKGQEIPIIKPYSMTYNKYFAEHPENMAGEMLFNFERGETRFPTSRALFPSAQKPQEQMLSKWVARFADMKEEAPSTSVEEEVTRINEKLGEGVKEGSMVLNSQGELCMARMGEAVAIMSPQAAKGKPQRTDNERLRMFQDKKVKGHTKAQCFEDYTAIKKALSDVLEYQSTNEDNAGLEPLLKELNRAFDTFTKKYGNLHKNPAISFLRNDVDFSSIMALETYSERGDKKGNKVVKVGKTDIFNRRVIETEKEPHPTTIKDGILASLYKSGGIDVDYISDALGKSAEEVKQEIVKSGLGYENPSTGAMEVSYRYLSGNVRDKLHIAQENNEDGRYDANIAALEKVIPMTIPAHLIEFALGSSWIEPKLYEDFVYDKTGIRVKLTNVGGTWFMKTPWSTFNEKNRAMAVSSKMCDKTIMGHELIEAAITNKQITVSKQVKNWDGTTETITDKAATAECSTKIDEIRSEFKDWARERMHADTEMSARIEETYNEQFNNYVPMSIPDEFVPQHFGGQVTELHGKPFALRPHQGRAVVRGTTEPILLAHEVGTGKTYTLITTAMEMRRLGTARKPMIVVQNATVGQFVESAMEIYPNAKVLTIEEADRTAEGRKNFYAKIKYNDWDMIVVPQSVFERIPDSPEREMAYTQYIIEEKMKVLEAMREADDDGRSMIVRQAEKELEEQRERLAELTEAIEGKKKKRDEKKEATTRQNAEVRAMEMLDREVDDVENFDDMGIDAILVDEAHEYKHLGFATAMQRGVKGVDPSFSKKSQGVYLKTQAVMERNHGRNVVFATGTPISNTAAEIWTFMRYLMPADQMKAYDIFYFDDFVRNFGNLAQMVEFKTNGKFAEVSRFAGYVNLPELVRIWSGVADTVLTSEAGGVSDKIPEMEGGKPTDIYLPQTRALRSVMKYVKAELERYDNMTGKEKKENSHIPLTMYGIAKAAAVDARLVISDAEDDPNSKTNATVREILRSLKESAKYKGTLAIFSDNYQNKRSGFNLYEEIRNKLIAEGVPAEQIVVIKSGMTVKKKLDIFDKVNAGEVRVILGSTFTLGTGVNIQERLHTLIHVDAPNRPMDYTQRNGRAMRQGNLHKDMGIPVRIIRFGVEDSLDVTAYQRLKTKGAIADSIMNGSKMMQNSMENRVLEEEEDTFGDMTAQLSGSQYAILKNQAEREVRNLTAKQKGHEIDQIYVHNQLPKVEGFIKGAQRRIEIETKNLEIIGKHFPDGTIKKITIGKLSFDSVEGMEDFFKEQNAKMNEVAETIREGAENWMSRLTIDIDGLPFEVTTTVTREVDKSGQGTLSFEPERKVTYSCEALGIKDRTVKGNRIKNVMQEIAERIVTGAESRELLSRGKNQLAHYSEDYRQLQARNGKEFEHKQQLAEAKERLAKYEELMKKELEEKEAKYAEMDKAVDAATDVTFDDDSEDTPTSGDGNKYRDGEDLSEGERLRAIRALKPIEVKRNDMSRAELREVYNNLPSVEKDGREIEFYRSAFKKIYKDGGLFGQVVPVLDEVLEESVLAYSDSDNLVGMVRPDGTVHKEHKNIQQFDNYVGKVRIGNISYYVRTTVQHEIGQSGMHSVFVSNVAVYENPTESRTIPITSRGTTDFNGIVDAKLQQFFERASSEALELDKKDRVNELSEQLHTPIRIIEDVNSPSDKPLSRRERRAKAWWSSTTDEVVVVLPNNVNVADVDNTVVHEVVGHKGLRAFIGEERFDEFLDEVYGHALGSIRKRIDALTDRMIAEEVENRIQEKLKGKPFMEAGPIREAYKKVAEREAEQKREQFRKEATEEYMADLGGRIGSEGFEKMSRDELTLWGKIKAKVQQFLDKFLQGLKIAKSIRLSDKDLSYILFESWKYARETKTGHGDVIMEAESVVRRQGTRFSEPREHDLMEVRKEAVADRIEELFDQAVEGKLTGKPVEVGRLTEAGRKYLEQISGLQMKQNVSFVLNPSDLVHMYRDHFGENEKDKGNNIPLTKEDIRHIGDVICNPERIVYGVEPDGLKRNLFYFLSSTQGGTYNLLEIYGDRKGNLTAKTFYKTKKAVSQRVLSLMKSEHLTSVTDGASLSDAKLPKFFEYPKTEGEEDKIRFRDPGMGLEETITRMKTEAMQANVGNLQAKRDAMRAIGGNLNHLRQAMARQREYDITTVKSVSDLARVLMEAGLLDDLSKYESKRILGAINNVVGKQDVSQYVQKVMDIMVDNQLRLGANTLGRLLSIRGSRVDARGIEVQGELDPEGQRIAQVVRKSTSLPKDDIDNRIADALNRMGSADTAIADEATIEYAGLQIARQYVEEITESKAEEKELRDSIKQAKEDKDAGQMTEAAYKQYVEATNDAIRQNKIDRAEAFHSLVEQVGDVMCGSIERAKAWREAEKQRVEEIHHNANSDMEGRPTYEHHKDDRTQKIVNNSFARFLLAPLATFDQMLRMFGKKNTRGEGYLWNRYMRGWVDASEKEYTGYRDALKVLDDKVSEVFGKKMSWGDLFSIDRKLPKAFVSFWDGGEMKDHELTQGNMLYIYMADKMSDGRMKLRRMGITEDDIENIKNFLDQRFIELADWMQDEFLVDKRNEYNEVHKRMFGASMAAIENYFPLKILANARLENVDVADDTTDNVLPATSTGSIIKRRRNNLALDVTGANAFSVILDHLQQMERWAAFAEFNRDLNTLLSYKRFRNQVMNMSSVYGAGKTLWNNFRNVCSMAAGAYRPPIATLDKSAVNIAKGVTAAKVNFRLFTALKQFLSMPAYLSDSNPVYLIANIANPIGAWKWSMENLPLFEKRWKSRMAGDPRLLKTDMDWKMWRSRVVEIASRVGMSPNAFVDALTVAIGTHAMYQTKLAKYKRQGYDTDVAETRAKQDATILFNQTQQSSEGAFLSTMQVDRSWLSVLFTVFRNSNMSYTRQLYDAMRNIGHRLTPGYKGMSVEFMSKQMRRDGIDPDQADRNAKREYRRGIIRDLVRVGVFGYVLQFAWNLGEYLPYLILGDNEDEKDKMMDDVFNHSMFGSIEGLTGGDAISAAGNQWLKGDFNLRGVAKNMPVTSDLEAIYDKMGRDQVSVMNDVINLCVQSGIGVNPQSLTDAVTAVMDFCGDDAETSRECALLMARVFNCPQSQIDKIYFDELDASAKAASKMTPSEIAERYARYKVRRGVPLTGWAYGSEQREKLMEKYRDRSNTLAKERLSRETDNAVSQNMAEWLNEFKQTKDRVSEINKVKSKDEDRYYEILDELEATPEFERYLIIKDYKREVDALTKDWLRAKTAGERDSCVRAIVSLKREMVSELQQAQ